jgi:hypothetical protein
MLVTVPTAIMFELRFQRPVYPPQPPDIKSRKEPWSETGRRGSFLLLPVERSGLSKQLAFVRASQRQSVVAKQRLEAAASARSIREAPHR